MNEYNLTKEQMARVYDGYAVNIQNGFVYVNDHGDLEFVDSDSHVDENIQYQPEEYFG
jgi:hypothetical protein